MFKNRTHAGEFLAENLSYNQYDPDTCLLAVPRGGVEVAAPIAQKLQLSLSVLIAKKLGHPHNPEVAIGAVMPDGSAVWDEQTIAALKIGQAHLNRLLEEEYAEVKRRMLSYTGTQQPPEVTHKTVVIVDDGIATGYTLRAAVHWLKTLSPSRIVIAAPVAPPEVIKILEKEADEVICPFQPAYFGAVGMYYEDFSQTSDAAVLHILHEINANFSGHL